MGPFLHVSSTVASQRVIQCCGEATLKVRARKILLHEDHTISELLKGTVKRYLLLGSQEVLLLNNRLGIPAPF